ncbi:hypothetical protein FXO37_01347 [Capsicum annuum]|nr:hypothetical protein FXO37_01347 [Capsicum annuum]
MESGPSFSLGLTQIESTSNEINISGFVPGSFAYEDVGFHENRSKHRNDLTIMKKLWDAATVTGKKTVVAISKEKRKEVVKRDPLPKGMKYVIKTVLHHPWRFDISFNHNFVIDVEYFVDQENINAHLSVKKVNESPSGTSNTITDPINEEAPHEPSLMNFGEQTPPTEQNPPIVESVRESTQKINVSGGIYHEQVLMKVDMNVIESLVKTYVDKRFDDIEALMKNHHEEMKKQHEEMMLALKEKHYAPQKVVIEIDSSNKDVEKNETHCDDLGTLKEHSKDVPERESETKFNNVAFQHIIDNTIADFSSPVSAIQFEELLQKENLPDLILPIKNTEVLNELQDVIDNIIASMCTPIAAMAVNSDNLSQKVNLPDLSLQTGNVEVPNKLRESTKNSSTDVSQEMMDNIIAGISTSVVAIKMKSVSPTEISNNEFQIHDIRFPSLLSESELGKQDAIKTRASRNRKRKTIFRSPFTTKFGSNCKGKESATINFSRKHPFDGYLISHDIPTGLIEEYCAWIVQGLLKFHEKNLEAYIDKMSKVAGDLNETPFDAEYVEDISQQASESLNCGVFLTAYAEFFSDQIQIPPSNLDAKYLRKRYASLLWNYGVKKANKIYYSDHDDPPRPRSFYVSLTDESNILTIE